MTAKGKDQRSPLKVLLVTTMALLMASPALAASVEELQVSIDARQALMKEMRKALGGFVPMLKGDKPWQPAEVQRLAEVLRADSKKILTLFPQGTSSDQRFTMALPVIWQDWSAFEAAAKVQHGAALRLKELAQGRDTTALTKQVEAVMNGCMDCHKKFRLNK
jgi:cytochrome c556